MIMHEWYGSWVENDRFGMILACEFTWDDWLAKWHGASVKYTSIFMDLDGRVGMDSTWHVNEDWL